jgi:hypothetical protein
MVAHARNHRRGFSALELAMVILCIMVFTSLFMFSGARAREKARTASCQSNLTQMAMSAAMYAADHDGRYPAAACPATLYPYVKNLQVFRCPSAPAREVPRPWDYVELPAPPPPGPSGMVPGPPGPVGMAGPPQPAQPGPTEPERWQVDYLFALGLTSDMRPNTILAYDDAPDRHPSRTFNYVRIDGAAIRAPAADWPDIPPHYEELSDHE